MNKDKKNPKHSQSVRPERRRAWRIGPFTLTALVLCAAVAYAQFTKPVAQASLPADSQPGHVVYEADASGQLRRVATPAVSSESQKPLPPLWKPEVGLLVSSADTLKLTEKQRNRLHKLDNAWQREKADWQRQFDSTAADAGNMLHKANTETGASLSAIAGGMSDYSQMSAAYDSRRINFWKEGLHVLSVAQRRTFDQLRRAEQNRN